MCVYNMTNLVWARNDSIIVYYKNACMYETPKLHLLQMAWVVEDHIVIVVLLSLFFTVCVTLYMVYRERRHSIEKIRMLGWQEQQRLYAGDQQYAAEPYGEQPRRAQPYEAQQYIPQAQPYEAQQYIPQAQPVQQYGQQPQYGLF
jgi:hypothetical protein